MTLEELARNVRSMRQKQSAYYRKPSPQLLAEARDWEKRVDQAVTDVLAPPRERGLFEQSGEYPS